MKKKSKVIVIVIIAVILVVAGLIFRGRGTKEIPVTTEMVKSGPLRSIVTASGNIVSHKAINISANIPGEIKEIAVEEGDRVEKGDLLIVIDPELYLAQLRSEEASLASAEAELTLAKANYQRAQKIYEEEQPGSGEALISQEEYERIEAEYRVAQSNWSRVKALVESARTNVAKTSIYSSISGVLTSLNVEEGEVAVTGTMNNPGTVLMTVSDLSKMQAEVDVDETDIVEVEIGQVAEVTIDAYPDTTFRGVVSEIGNSPIISNLGVGGEEAVDFKVVIDLIDSPANLKPGLSTTADIISDTRENALYIAIQALTMRSVSKDGRSEDTESEDPERVEKEGVFVVKDGKAIFSPVVTGISDGMNIEIVSGLTAGDEVITGSFQTIRTLKDSSDVSASPQAEESNR
jgi:HlyD family secretion protein